MGGVRSGGQINNRFLEAKTFQLEADQGYIGIFCLVCNFHKSRSRDIKIWTTILNWKVVVEVFTHYPVVVLSH